MINRSQSGSFQHRCMGAGLRQNLGPAWGSIISSEPNEILKRVTSEDEKKV